MSNLEIRIKSSILSSFIEIFATHPLDYAKTLIQNNNKITLKQYLKNPYKGCFSRVISIVPMRIFFWNSYSYFNNNGYGLIQTSILTASLQTIIDYPSEQIKIQRIIHNKSIFNAFKQQNIFMGAFFTLTRNIGFTLGLATFINNNNGSYYHGAVGGFVGALITHPLDSLKTWYQTGNIKYPKHWTIVDYYKGWYFRAGMSLISMNIGWFIYSNLHTYYEK
jgi:hypothetical protein